MATCSQSPQYFALAGALLLGSGASWGCGGSAKGSTVNGDIAPCAALSRTSSGAASGALTLSGHVLDASGAAIVGARIDLSGSAAAVRYTNLTGGYAFHVSTGSYQLAISGDCVLSPANGDFGNVAADQAQDFSAADGCVGSTPSDETSTGSLHNLTQNGSALATVSASIEENSSAAEAQASLKEIAAEQPGIPSCSFAVNGNPGLERQATVTTEGPLDGPNITQLNLTTAIATGDSLVRFETVLGTDAAPDTIDRVLAAGRDFTPDELPELHGP